ncbi:MAG: YggS family pyridoxal phosphate-dependent enzyme [Alphaproteobacteria bacterium]|nr:YggS family pyridoxal phosphate-dependent enzyme [Alphaproteobacteria bacterium]
MSDPAPNAAERLEIIRAHMRRAALRFDPGGREVVLVAVSKTFGAAAIEPVIAAGQRIFGENRVQESLDKWPELKQRHADIELHLIGPLQTNKARDAVALFDVIETVDRDRIAAALAREMTAQHRRLPCLVQVNIGAEEQKAGISVAEALGFIGRCKGVHGLDIVGLMGIPPVEAAPGPYFALLKQLADAAGLAQVSMGMSGDFETAIAMGATHVRVGSAIFGARPAGMRR